MAPQVSFNIQPFLTPLPSSPPQVDFILNMTGVPKLAIVGHSQGCTLTLMMLSWRAEYNDKLWLIALMGPVVHSEYIETPFLKQQAATGSSLVGGAHELVCTLLHECVRVCSCVGVCWSVCASLVGVLRGFVGP